MMNYFDWVEITIMPQINWHLGAVEWTAKMRTMKINESDQEIYSTYELYAVSGDLSLMERRYVWINPGNTLQSAVRFGSKEAASTFATNAFNDFVDLCKQYDEAEVQHIYPLG